MSDKSREFDGPDDLDDFAINGPAWETDSDGEQYRITDGPPLILLVKILQKCEWDIDFSADGGPCIVWDDSEADPTAQAAP